MSNSVKAVKYVVELTICAVNVSTTTVTCQMSDDTGKTGRIFVFIEMDLSTTSTTSSVVVIIGHSTDFSSTVHVRFVKIIAVYDYW